MYILDTNILIYFFKGMGDVVTQLLSVPPKEIAIPAVVLHELEYGIAKSTSPKKRIRQLEEICSLVRILAFGREEARLSGQIRAQLDKKGMPIGSYDVLIAGTALANQGTLVTNNTKEFSRISRLDIINWY